MTGPFLLIIGGAAVLSLTALQAIFWAYRADNWRRHWRTLARRKKPGPDRRAADRAAILSTMNLIRSAKGLPEFRA